MKKCVVLPLALTLMFKYVTNNPAKLNVYVDGQLLKTIDSTSPVTWDYAGYANIFLENTAKKVKVRLEPVGTEGQKFWLLGISH